MVPYSGVERRKDVFHQLPDNVVLIQFSTQRGWISRMGDLIFLFSGFFWKEVYFFKKNYHIEITRQRINNLLFYLGKAAFFRRTIKRFLKRNRIPFYKTTIYTYHLSEYTLGMVWLNQRRGVQGVFSRYFFLDDELEPKFGTHQPFRRYIQSNITGLFPVSNHSFTHAIEENGITNKVNVFLHRLGVRFVAPNKPTLKENSFRILTVSFLEKYKHISLLVEALELVEHLEIDWHHVGEGGDPHNMKQFAFNHLFNKPNIRFRFTSDVKSEKVYEIFESEKPHVFICISQREDVPVSILEAFSFGVPVIATRVGGIAELLTHEKNGLLISANSGPEDLVSAIKRIATLNENSYAEMSNCARQTFIDHCQAENNYNAMVYDMFQLSKQHER